ncbi:hypothetical protein D3C76_1076780 [compost metagenome]
MHGIRDRPFVIESTQTVDDTKVVGGNGSAIKEVTGRRELGHHAITRDVAAINQYTITEHGKVTVGHHRALITNAKTGIVAYHADVISFYAAKRTNINAVLGKEHLHYRGFLAC